jgi:hypothetical protein
MESKIIWLFTFVGLYWAYCLFWGIKGAKSAKTSADYFIAGWLFETSGHTRCDSNGIIRR